MSRQPRPRFWFEVSATALGALFTVLTFVSPTWIEDLFRASPDNGSGQSEWFIALVPLAFAATSALFAVREWRHAPAR